MKCEIKFSVCNTSGNSSVDIRRGPRSQGIENLSQSCSSFSQTTKLIILQTTTITQ